MSNQEPRTVSDYSDLAASAQGRPWEVAVACDARLGEILATNSMDVREVSIDPAAIHTILNDFNSGGGGEVLFLAVHEDAIPANQNKGKRAAGQTTNGDIITAYVGVAGNNLGVGRRILEPLNGYLKESGTADTPFVPDDFIAGATIADPEAVQIVSVHELKHAADLRDAKVWEDPKKDEDALANKLAIVAGAMLASLPLGATLASRYFKKKPLTSLGIGLLTAAGTFAAGNTYRNITTKRLSNTVRDLVESRADAVEENACRYPEVIRLVSETLMRHLEEI